VLHTTSGNLLALDLVLALIRQPFRSFLAIRESPERVLGSGVRIQRRPMAKGVFFAKLVFGHAPM